jgi:hypothetical protein
MIPIVITITPIATDMSAKLFQVICADDSYRRALLRRMAMVVPMTTMSTMLMVWIRAVN